VNYMVQSSAADMIKSGMIRCHEFFRQNGIDAHTVMTIHDELVFEVRKEELTNQLIRKVQELMEDVEGCMDIEMPTDASLVYYSWTDKQELEWKNGRYIVKEKKKA
jgi:DNA polymerase-1